MSRLIFAINVTVDGCCDHTQVIPDEELHSYYRDLIDGSDGILFGRATYELLASHWPSVAKSARGPEAEVTFARVATEKPKYVFSRTRDNCSWENSFGVNGHIAEQVSMLKQQHSGYLVLLASPSLASSASRLDLIDEYRLLVQPIVAGRGPTLFHNVGDRRDLKLVNVQRFNSGVAAMTYVPVISR
jgi:dihydrofolate reductase